MTGQLAETVEVWSGNLDGFSLQLGDYLPLLSQAERDRSQRFALPILRDRFIVRRGVLRRLLGDYLGISPESVTLEQTAERKPILTGEHLNFHFNVSESAGMAVFGFAVNCEIGVDVEKEKNLDELSSLIRQFFHPNEVRSLFEMPAEHLSGAFFALWTRKEAYLKAIGKGLLVSLNEFEVSTNPEAAAKLLQPWLGHQGQIVMESFSPAEGFRGAIAYSGRQRTVKYRLLEEHSLP